MKKIGLILLFSLFQVTYANDLSLEIDQIVKSYVSSNGFQGNVYVSKDHQVVFSQSYGNASIELNVPNQSITKFRIGSISKQFTSAGILILQQEGKLNVLNKISKYMDVPEAWKDITIHHLLTHTAGLPRDIPVTLSEYSKYHQLSELVDSLRLAPLIEGAAPGDKFRYSNAGYTLLAFLAQSISGLDFDVFLKNKILIPAGLKDTGIDHDSLILSNRASGYVFIQGELYHACGFDLLNVLGAGAGYSTVGDLDLWLKALEDGKILTAESLKMLFTPWIKHQIQPWSYAYGWIIDEWMNKKVVWHNGAVDGYLSDLAQFPDDGIVIEILANRMDKPLADYMTEMRYKIAEKLFEIKQ